MEKQRVAEEHNHPLFLSVWLQEKTPQSVKCSLRDKSEYISYVTPNFVCKLASHTLSVLVLH